MREGGADEAEAGVGEDMGDIDGDDIGEDVEEDAAAPARPTVGEPGVLGGRGRVNSERVALLIHWLISASTASCCWPTRSIAAWRTSGGADVDADEPKKSGAEISMRGV